MRASLRGLVNHLTQIGIPSGRVALEMQFTSSPGPRPAGRAPARLELARDREARGARGEVRRDPVQAGRRLVVGLGDVQPERDARPGQAGRRLRLALGARPDASATARPPPARTSTRSLTEGQLDVPAGAALRHERRHDRPQRRRRFTTLTGDPGYAASVLLEQLVLGRSSRSTPKDVLSAERAVIAASFGGDRTQVLGGADDARKLTLADARSIIAARLERDDVEATLQAAGADRRRRSTTSSRPTATSRRGSSRRRRRRPGSAAPRAAGRSRRSLRPRCSRSSAPGTIDTPDGTFDVTPLGPGAAARAACRRPTQVAAARSALGRLARDARSTAAGSAARRRSCSRRRPA